MSPKTRLTHSEFSKTSTFPKIFINILVILKTLQSDLEINAANLSYISLNHTSFLLSVSQIYADLHGHLAEISPDPISDICPAIRPPWSIVIPAILR